MNPLHPIEHGKGALSSGPHHLFAPDTALIALTCGILLIYLELNRPGRILPGSFGLLVAILAVPSLSNGPSTIALPLVLATSTALIAFGLRRTVHPVVPAVATLGLVFGFNAIAGVKTDIAILCGLILGVASSLLARIARRARLNKGLD